MSGYLYFPNNSKDKRRPYIGLPDKLQKPFLINGSSFQRISIMAVSETNCREQVESFLVINLLPN